MNGGASTAPPPDHYAVLELPRDAEAAAIRAARRRMLRRHHPDVSPDGKAAAEERTRAILVASAVLLDARTRAEYDREWLRRHAPRAPAPSAPADATGPLVPCTACGRMNAARHRGYCMYCGAGLGARPRPVRVDPVAARRNLDPPPFADAGCGALLGGVAGGLLATRLVWGGAELAGWLVAAIVIVPGVLVAALAYRHGTRFWARISGVR